MKRLLNIFGVGLRIQGKGRCAAQYNSRKYLSVYGLDMCKKSRMGDRL